MASYEAVGAVLEALAERLRKRSEAAFGVELNCRVVTTAEFEQASPAEGVSLFLYRIFPCGARRPTSGFGGGPGSLFNVELHFLLTAWAESANRQHAIAGWMMQTLAVEPALAAEELNQIRKGVFGAADTVEVSHAGLSNSELLELWESLGLGPYRLCAPYVVRGVNLEQLDSTG